MASETPKLNTLTIEAKNAITLLKERRAALIAAAVTGQIDVRGAAEAGLGQPGSQADAHGSSEGP